MWLLPSDTREWELEDGCVEVADVKAGESIYVPMSWGHAVHNLDNTAMANFWINDTPFVIQNFQSGELLR